MKGRKGEEKNNYKKVELQREYQQQIHRKTEISCVFKDMRTTEKLSVNRQKKKGQAGKLDQKNNC